MVTEETYVIWEQKECYTDNEWTKTIMKGFLFLFFFKMKSFIVCVSEYLQLLLEYMFYVGDFHCDYPLATHCVIYIRNGNRRDNQYWYGQQTELAIGNNGLGAIQTGNKQLPISLGFWH